jgi:hypothetical protein
MSERRKSLILLIIYYKRPGKLANTTKKFSFL